MSNAFQISQNSNKKNHIVKIIYVQYRKAFLQTSCIKTRLWPKRNMFYFRSNFLLQRKDRTAPEPLFRDINKENILQFIIFGLITYTKIVISILEPKGNILQFIIFG